MSPTYSPLAVFLKVPMVAMILPFRFRDHDHHGLDGLGHDRGCRGRSRRPASLLEDGSAALFCLARNGGAAARGRSEGHTSELQSLMRISYAVFCLKKKNTERTHRNTHNTLLTTHRRVH